MKPQYDFSTAKRGRFYRKGATLRLPIYLGAKLQDQVESLATRTGRDIGDVVNQIVKNEIRLIDELATHKETEPRVAADSGTLAAQPPPLNPER